MSQAIRQTVQSILPEIQALRHELHQRPEIRFEEKWTSDRIASFLDSLNIPFRRGLAKGTGILATIDGGPGPCVALRTDIDALEIQEETGLPYASTIPNRMHACGHDGHMAILCGVAKTLAKHRDKIRGSVRLLFQPAEEIAGGARFMVEDGALDGVNAIFGLHGWPTVPLGGIGVKNGYLMASAQDFRIIVRGKGCHGADPAAGIDPILVAAHIITALQSLVSRGINPYECGVVTVAILRAGQATNIIPETAELSGTYRWFDESVGKTLRTGIERIATQVAAAFGATVTVTLTNVTYPPVCNDSAMTDHARAVIREVLGVNGAIEIETATMGAEDFAYYLQRVPGSFVWLGINPSSDEAYPSLHSPRFNFNDDAIPIGMEVMCRLAIDYLAKRA
jgi:amidohydrolase